MVTSSVVVGGQSVVVKGGVVCVVGGASVVVVVVRGLSHVLRQSSIESNIFGPLMVQKETLGTQDRESRL